MNDRMTEPTYRYPRAIVSTAQLASREGVLVLADERGRALADPEPARLLADVPGDEALRAREEACARAREACHRPSEQRLLERACGAAAER